MESSYSNKNCKSSSIVQLLEAQCSVQSPICINGFACVLSVLLFGYPAWFPEISDLRKLEQLNIHGLRWCFGYNDYSALLKLSNSLPICYQLIERDIRVFIAILNNKNCISFDKFFKLDLKVLDLRTLDRERLALTRAKKRCTEK